MNKIFKIASAAILAGSFVLPALSSARAEEREHAYAPDHNYAARMGSARSRDEFLDSHPDIRRDLTANPRLVDDRGYMRTHPGMETYMDQHPNIRKQWREYPRITMRHQEQWERKYDRDDRKDRDDRQERDVRHDRDDRHDRHDRNDRNDRDDRR
jgi:hypothetical protein